MLKRSLKNLTLVLYRPQHSPQAYEVSEGKIRFLVYTIGLITFISLASAVTILVYFKNIRESVRRKEPALIIQLRDENTTLKTDLTQMNKDMADINKRLQSSSAEVSAIAPMFSLPTGHKDITNQNLAGLDEVSFEKSDSKVIVKFNVINNASIGNRLSGHIFVILKQGHHVEIYPNTLEDMKSGITSFHLGETFTVSRFRPVIAEFKSIKGKSPSAKVVIFSRKGDLILNSEILE